MAAERSNQRLRLAVEVEYRTAGAFLVAYSMNLSASGMFIATDKPLQPGETLALTINVPGHDTMRVDAMVIWSRSTPLGDQPAGMGVQFTHAVDERYGELIDRLATQFRGLEVLIVAASPDARASLAQLARVAVSSARVVEAADAEVAEAHFEKDTADLVIVDLDDMAGEGLYLLRLAKTGKNRPLPVIVLATETEDIARARELGADAILPSPPSPAELPNTIVAMLAKPQSSRSSGG